MLYGTGMNDVADEELVRRAQKGERAAFHALVERYYPKILGFAYRGCGQRQDAEDMAQEVCVKLAQNLSSFRFESKFSTWFYRLGMNVIHDYHRKRKPTRQHEVIFEEGFDAASDDKSADEQLELKEVYTAVHGLSGTLRDTILLVCSEGLSHAEAGAILKCNENTVAWRINEAKKQLKAKLGA